MQDGSRREKAKNGATGGPVSPWLATAGGPPALYDDPMSKVLGLDSKTSTFGAWFGFTSGSTLLLVGFMALTSVVAWIHALHERTAAAAPDEIDVMKEDPPPPPPPPIEHEAKAEPAPPVSRPREAPPPPPAQAAKVLAQEPDPNEPVDLTGNVIVQGNADAYAGGFTTANGTNANAVHIAAAPSGVPGGTGAPKPAQTAARDCSRPASLGGGADWSCPFPPEADAAQIDEAYVMLQVDVRADGTPASVRVVTDPGNGFGREARRCAMAKRYPSALDHDCTPIPGTTKAFRVHFSR